MVSAAHDAASNREEILKMKYMLLIYGDEAAGVKLTKEQGGKMSASYIAYTEAMKKAGVFLAGERLKPTKIATTVRVAGGKTNVIDGPYADTKEQLGGYYLIEAPDMDAAISWAARCPGAGTGTMEVRPIWPMAEYMPAYTA